MNGCNVATVIVEQGPPALAKAGAPSFDPIWRLAASEYSQLAPFALTRGWATPWIATEPQWPRINPSSECSLGTRHSPVTSKIDRKPMSFLKIPSASLPAGAP